jgi:LytS/YehU family sensor histidine kinase
MQQYRLNLKLQTERKIASLQLKAVKNQVDPHFTLNILNAIGSLYATENNRDKADYIFGMYAKLIRQTVISSDQIIIPLAEELEFVRNYIDLEKFRCDNSFDYVIDIGKEIDLQTKIPRMLIHTFVENAIKYAIRSKSEGGLLKIYLSAKDHFYQILIEDNGPGLESSLASDKGTGKGLLILNELIDLYYKLEKVKITYNLQNITGPGNTISGTRAMIEIPQ